MVSSEKIGLNSIATVRFQDGSTKTFLISLHNTAPERGVISFGSPLGQALSGRGEGEHVSYHAAGNNHEVEIIKVFGESPPP